MIKIFSINTTDSVQIDQLTHLAQKTYIGTYRNLLSEDEITHRIQNKYQRQNFEEEISDPKNHFLGVSKDERLIGYVHFSNDAPPPCVSLKNGILLNRIYLLNEFQRSGFGKQVLQFVENQIAQGSCDGLFLYCYEMNHSAIHFYQQNGYKIAGKVSFSILPELYRCDVVMEKALK